MQATLNLVSSKLGLFTPKQWFLGLVVYFFYLVAGIIFLDHSDPGNLDKACPELFHANAALVAFMFLGWLVLIVGTGYGLIEYHEGVPNFMVDHELKHRNWISVSLGINAVLLLVPAAVSMVFTIQVAARSQCYDYWKVTNQELFWWNVSLGAWPVLYGVFKLLAFIWESFSNCVIKCCWCFQPADPADPARVTGPAAV